MSLPGKIGGKPDFTAFSEVAYRSAHSLLPWLRSCHPGRFVDFLVVKPYEAAKEHFSAPAEETTPADLALLTEIRDLLTRRGDPV